jgi:hypothetical protein
MKRLSDGSFDPKQVLGGHYGVWEDGIPITTCNMAVILIAHGKHSTA